MLEYQQKITVTGVIFVMSFGDAISSFKDNLETTLNSSAFSTDSVEGWILIVIMIMLAHSVWKKASKAIIWCFLGIIFFQIMYILAGTGLNEIILLKKVFKYDVLTAVAQCFRGTPICSVLLWFDSFLIVSLTKLWELGGDFFKSIWRVLSNLFGEVKDMGNSSTAGT